MAPHLLSTLPVASINRLIQPPYGNLSVVGSCSGGSFPKLSASIIPNTKISQRDLNLVDRVEVCDSRVAVAKL